MKLTILPFHFPPQKGGIATWLYSICTHLREDDLTVLADKGNGREQCDRTQPFKTFRTDLWETAGFIKLTQLIQDLRSSNKAHYASSDVHPKSLVKAIHCMNFRQVNYVINLSLLLLRKTRSGAPTSAIICGYALPDGIAAMIQKYVFGTPYVVLVHGMELFACQRTSSQKHLMREILANADAIIANSNYTKRLISEILPALTTDVTVVHSGIDIIRFLKASNTTKLKKRLGIGTEKVLITVANLVERKGHDMVIKTLPEILKDYPELKYVIVGDGDYRDKLEEHVRELNLEKHVTLVGTVADHELPFYFQLADIFVMPGRQSGVHVEGFGTAYIEAGACSKPVVAGKTGGVADAVVHGETGLLVDPLDESEIAGAILRLLQDDALAKELGENGRGRVAQEFTAQVSAEKVRHVVEKIARG